MSIILYNCSSKGYGIRDTQNIPYNVICHACIPYSHPLHLVSYHITPLDILLFPLSLSPFNYSPPLLPSHHIAPRLSLKTRYDTAPKQYIVHRKGLIVGHGPRAEPLAPRPSVGCQRISLPPWPLVLLPLPLPLGADSPSRPPYYALYALYFVCAQRTMRIPRSRRGTGPVYVRCTVSLSLLSSNAYIHSTYFYLTTY